MLSIYDEASAAAVLNQPLAPELRLLITNRLADAQTLGLEDQTHILIVGPGDTEAAIITEIGWSPLVHPIDEIRYGEAGFIPFWSWVEDLSNYYEIIVSSGNAGFAYILLVQQAEGVLPELLCMCREHCEDGEQQCAF